MIEKIRLDDNREFYSLTSSANDVIVVLCLSGKISIRNFWNRDEVFAILNPDETWTLSGGGIQPIVKSEEATGATFLIVRYFRS
jgi:hypothetical protein